MRATWGAALIALAATVAGAEPPAARAAAPALGLLLEAASPDVAALPRVDLAADAQAPVARLRVEWSRVASEPGAFDWAEVDAAVAGARQQGYAVALALVAGDMRFPTPLEPDGFAAWIAFVRAAVERFGAEAGVFEIGEDPQAAGIDAASYALFLKQSALAVRATASAAGRSALLAASAAAAGDGSWRRDLWAHDLAAYIDILPLRLDAAGGGAAAAAAVNEVRAETLLHPPAAALWVYVDGAEDWSAPAVAVAALAAGAEVAAVAPAGAAGERMRWIAALQGLLGAGFAPAPGGSLHIVGGAEPGTVLGSFFRSSDATTLVVYELHGEPSPPARLVVSSSGIGNARTVDLLEGRTQRIPATRVEGARGQSELWIVPATAPAAALYERPLASAGLDLPPEDLEVASHRELTAEEIIARHQGVQREQDDGLERWIARGRIDFHFRLTQAGTGIDFSIDSNYFWERGAELEWEQTQYWLNGNQITWKNIPELPLIQPEKVVTLPLDLTLDRTYVYRRVADERVGDREAYVLEFHPADPATSLALYRGRVWIDRGSFVRLKTALIQSELDPPVISNEEIDLLAPQVGPAGREYWLYERIDGQQVWNAVGRTFVVRREVTFTDYRINPPAEEFAAARAAAYASRNQMLRDTAEGFRYLERQDDGSRTVKQGVDTSQLFGAVGVFKDHSTSGVVPLAGVNWFDYEVGKRGWQLNAFFAGVFAFVTASDPTVLGGSADLTFDAGLSGLKVEDRVYAADEEVEIERMRRRSQSFAVRLGFPFGQFFKLTLIGRAGYNEFDDEEDASAALEELVDAGAASVELVLPQNHAEWAGDLETVYNRRGWSVSARGRWATRSDWEAWGLRDTDTGEFGSAASGEFVPGAQDPVERSYARWGLGAAKEWYLPRFQKLRLSADALGGSRLDRFSRYGFSFFDDDRLSGFSGSGVRFDRGALLRAGYSFNVFQAIRFDAGVETARVEREGAVEGRQKFTGLGLSGNVVAPWKSVVSVSYGYALASDVPELEGQQEFLLLWFKLF